MTEKTTFTHKTEKEEVTVIDPDAIHTITKNDQRMIKYYARNTTVTVLQKKNENGEYIDTEIYINYYYHR
jgi:hypothetical protein